MKVREKKSRDRYIKRAHNIYNILKQLTEPIKRVRNVPKAHKKMEG